MEELYQIQKAGKILFDFLICSRKGGNGIASFSFDLPLLPANARWKGAYPNIFPGRWYYQAFDPLQDLFISDLFLLVQVNKDLTFFNLEIPGSVLLIYTRLTASAHFAASFMILPILRFGRLIITFPDVTI